MINVGTHDRATALLSDEDTRRFLRLQHRRFFRKVRVFRKRPEPLRISDLRTNPRTSSIGPFGETIRATGPVAAENVFRFSAKYTDVETGLVMYPYRPYLPPLGRWLSRDPIEEDGGANLHAFVKNSPVDETDPLGMCIWTRRWDLPATTEKCRTVDKLINRRAVGFNQTLWDHWKAGSGSALTTNIEKYDPLGLLRARHTLLAHKQGWENGMSVGEGSEGMTTYNIVDEPHTSFYILPMSYGHRWNVTCKVSYKRPCAEERARARYSENAVLVRSSCEFRTTDTVDYWNNGAEFYLPGFPIDHYITDRLVRACFPSGKGFSLTSEVIEETPRFPAKWVLRTPNDFTMLGN